MAQNQTATMEQARKMVRLRTTLQMPSYGIWGQLSTGQIMHESEFVAGSEPPILLIKVVDRKKPEDSANVAEFDDFINVGKEYEMIVKAPNTSEALHQIIANENPGISRAAAEDRIDNLNGVSIAWEKAVTEAVKAI